MTYYLHAKRRNASGASAILEEHITNIKKSAVTQMHLTDLVDKAQV